MRLKSLDFLRGIAVILVLGRHMQSLSGVDLPYVVYQGLRLWRNVGWCGVDLFFVLSGFLVSGLLFADYKRHGELHIKRFLVRRGFKIYPAFYFFLFTTLFLTQFTPRRLLVEVFFVQSYAERLWGHTWSLAVEEHFYLLLPLFLLLLIRRRLLDFLPFIIPAILLAILGLRVAHVVFWKTEAMHYFTHLRVDSLLFGVFVSYFYHFKQEQLSALAQGLRYPLLICGLLLVSPALLVNFNSDLMNTLGFTSVYLGFGCILLFALYSQANSRLLSFVPLIGYYSYSIYLWHFALRALAQKYISLPYVPLMALYMVASVAVGIVMAKIIEMPFLRLRDRLFPDMRTRKPEVVAVPVAYSLVIPVPNSGSEFNQA